jgi:hypothetical protein
MGASLCRLPGRLASGQAPTDHDDLGHVFAGVAASESFT